MAGKTATEQAIQNAADRLLDDPDFVERSSYDDLRRISRDPAFIMRNTPTREWLARHMPGTLELIEKS